MNEEHLEENLGNYKIQLSQISSLLTSADAEAKLELYDLEKDLTELISVTEESLLSLKKERLFARLNESSTDTVAIGNTNQKTVGESSKHEPTEDAPDFVGTKCRVKYTQAWGGFQYHNAMVLAVEEDEDDDVGIRVLFLNPVHESMLPCKYFMDGRCTFDDDCRYSHGYLVAMNDVHEFKEPEFSNLTEGAKCLAKYENEIWYSATVCKVGEEQATVLFDSYNETITLDLHSILPFPESSKLSSDDDDDDDDVYEGSESEEEYTTIEITGPMAQWEQHTKGIGSKLMAKMGYILGKGLGKDSQGRVDPVEIRLLPPGKSLDYVAELRKKGVVKDPTKTKAKIENSKIETPTFDIINNLTLGSTPRNRSTQQKVKFTVEDSYKSMKKDRSRQQCKDVRQTKKPSSSSLNVEMMRNGGKMAALRKKLAHMKKSLERNPGETTISRAIKCKISEAERELDDLDKREQNIQEKLNIKSQTKKLSIF